MTVTRIPACTVCDKEIIVRFPSRLKGRKYCSVTCAGVMRRGEYAYQWRGGPAVRARRSSLRRRAKAAERNVQASAERAEKKRAFWPEYQCAHCEALFCRRRSETHNAHRVFCDSRCQYDYLRAHPTLGSAHPRYKGRKRQHYGNSTWRRLRRCILSQVNQCADCKVKRGLVIHHLIPVADGGTDNYHNLVVLCRPCHMRWHRLGSQLRLVAA